MKPPPTAPASFQVILVSPSTSNVGLTVSATVTVSISTDNGSTYHAIASTVAVPADATLMLIDKNNAFYLDETDLLRIVGSANGDLTYLVSGEKITD